MIAFFYDIGFTVSHYSQWLGVKISKEFILCASAQLSADFEQKTGIKPTNAKLISLVTDRDFFSYTSGKISTVKQLMYVNHNWNQVAWSWYSKSDKIVDMADTDFKCNDLVFSFGQLDALLIQKQMYPKEVPPFKLKELTYELKVERLNQEMTIEATFRDSLANKELVQQDALAFVAKFNDKLLKKNYSGVHNFQPRVEGDKIVFDIDTGATGPVFLKQFLKFLSDQDVFERVEVI